VINASAHTVAADTHNCQTNITPFKPHSLSTFLISVYQNYTAVKTGIESKGCQPNPTSLNPDDLFTALTVLMAYTVKTVLEMYIVVGK
jgi:hypothetical protein